MLSHHVLLSATVLLCSFWCNPASASEVTAAELKALLKAPLSDHTHVFVEFYAPWCGHCKSLAPKWEYLTKKLSPASKSGVAVVKIDADKHGADLKRFGVQGFPTVMLFTADEGATEGDAVVKRNQKKYESIREPKQMLQFINKHTGSSFSADDYVAAAPAARSLTPTQKQLYAGFKLANEFKFTAAKAALKELMASDDQRSSRSAGRMFDKLEVIGFPVGDLVVDDWLQVDLDTFQVPEIKTDGSITMVCRLDFRSSSRADLEPLIDNFLEIPGTSVIRVTGTEVEVPDEINYPVAVSENKRVFTGAGLDQQLLSLQSALLVQNGRIIWNGHLGIVDDALLKSVKAVAEGAHPKSLDVAEPGCDSDPEDDEGSCTKPHAHDEL